MKLHQQRCVPCKGGIPPLRGKILKKYMSQVKGWKKKGNKITKEYSFADDNSALRFLNRIGKESVKEGHHPAATWVYNRITVKFWTHAINGLSPNDFIMAAKFDKIYNKR